MSDQQRIRELAVMFGVPDGGRYINDWKERADQIKRWEAELAVVRGREAQLRAALEQIAESYPWEPYDADERYAHGRYPIELPSYPTNRRIARETLAALAASPAAEERDAAAEERKPLLTGKHPRRAGGTGALHD
jgi:hypothetical protein